MQNIEPQRVKYSQSSIMPNFNVGLTSVETCLDALPYTAPLEVMTFDNENYISFDNRRLFSAKKYNPNTTMRCIVYNANDIVTTLMQDNGLDLLTVIWSSENILHCLQLRANTIEAVFVIRCASQNSHFPFSGTAIDPQLSHQRIYDHNTIKIYPASRFMVSQEDYTDCLRNSTEIYIRVVPGMNIFHKRNDLGELILNRPDLYTVLSYEQCTESFTLRARSQKDSDVWDDWDDFLAHASEAEGDREESYLMELFESLKHFM